MKKSTVLHLFRGYIVKISGKVDTPNGKKNPNCFDYRLYLQSVGITNTMTAEDIKILNKRDTLGGKLHLLKRLLRNENGSKYRDRSGGLRKRSNVW